MAAFCLFLSVHPHTGPIFPLQFVKPANQSLLFALLASNVDPDVVLGSSDSILILGPAVTEEKRNIYYTSILLCVSFHPRSVEMHSELNYSEQERDFHGCCLQ